MLLKEPLSDFDRMLQGELTVYKYKMLAPTMWGDLSKNGAGRRRRIILENPNEASIKELYDLAEYLNTTPQYLYNKYNIAKNHVTSFMCSQWGEDKEAA